MPRGFCRQTRGAGDWRRGKPPGRCPPGPLRGPQGADPPEHALVPDVVKAEKLVRRTKCELESSRFGRTADHRNRKAGHHPLQGTVSGQSLPKSTWQPKKESVCQSTRRRPGSDIVDDVSRPRTWHLTVGLALFFGSVPTAAAQGTDVDPASLIGGSSSCPTPARVWQHVVPLVASPTLVDRIRSLGGPAAPVQIVDLGPSFRVTVGSHVREYTEETRDCAKRAAVRGRVLGNRGGSGPGVRQCPPPCRRRPSRPLRAVAVGSRAAPAAARIRLDLGATAAAALGGGARR